MKGQNPDNKDWNTLTKRSGEKKILISNPPFGVIGKMKKESKRREMD
ncbi:MAG: hypothetical protein V8T82_03170 [Romboutsia timonensis]